MTAARTRRGVQFSVLQSPSYGIHLEEVLVEFCPSFCNAVLISHFPDLFAGLLGSYFVRRPYFSVNRRVCWSRTPLTRRGLSNPFPSHTLASECAILY